MMRSKQAIQLPSSTDSHEALTVWIISRIERGVYRRKRQKTAINAQSLQAVAEAQRSVGFCPGGALFIESLGVKTIFCASLARGAAGRRLRAVS
jgi:hypothetical protein